MPLPESFHGSLFQKVRNTLQTSNLFRYIDAYKIQISFYEWYLWIHNSYMKFIYTQTYRKCYSRMFCKDKYIFCLATSDVGTFSLNRYEQTLQLAWLSPKATDTCAPNRAFALCMVVITLFFLLCSSHNQHSQVKILSSYSGESSFVLIDTPHTSIRPDIPKVNTLYINSQLIYKIVAILHSVYRGTL